MLSKRNRRLAGALVAAAAVVAALLAPAPALAVTELEYEPTVNPVADNPTHVQVNKLEKGNRNNVSGAKLQILDPEGNVVDEWTSDGKAHDLTGKLSVGVEYTLHEVSAPKGYEVASDTKFVLESVDAGTSGKVTSGKDAEFAAVTGSGADQCFVIDLYDKAVIEAEKEVHVKGESKTSSKLAQTGDPTPYGLFAGLAVAGGVAVFLGLKRRKDDNKQ